MSHSAYSRSSFTHNNTTRALHKHSLYKTTTPSICNLERNKRPFLTIFAINQATVHRARNDSARFVFLRVRIPEEAELIEHRARVLTCSQKALHHAANTKTNKLDFSFPNPDLFQVLYKDVTIYTNPALQ